MIISLAPKILNMSLPRKWPLCILRGPSCNKIIKGSTNYRQFLDLFQLPGTVIYSNFI